MTKYNIPYWDESGNPQMFPIDLNLVEMTIEEMKAALARLEGMDTRNPVVINTMLAVLKNLLEYVGKMKKEQ